MSSDNIAIRMLAHETGPGTLTTLPILILNLHENCNCRCAMCDIWKRPAGDEMSLERIRGLQADIMRLKVEQIVLTGGEPLLHSHFAELCHILRECPVRLTLLTTGLLLSKKAAVIVECVDEIIVSLDGPRDIHNSVRSVRRAFDLLHDGITAVRCLRPEIQVHARTTIQKSNFHSLRQTVNAARHLGCASISFLAVDTTSQAFNRELIWPNQEPQTGLSSKQTFALQQEMESLITEYEADFCNGYIRESPQKLRQIVRYFQSQLGGLPRISPICDAPWVSAVIEVDGALRPCFFHRVVAEIRNHSLSEALNSDSAIEFRRNLRVPEDSTCQNCVCSLNYRKRSLFTQPPD